MERIEDLITPPELGEMRPAWWYDVWYNNGIIIYGEIVDKEEQITEIIKLKSNNNNRVRQLGLGDVSIKIERMIQITEGERQLNSGYFDSGKKVEVSSLSEYKEEAEIWIHSVDLKRGQKCVFLLSDVGIVKPGHYFIKWSLGKDYIDVIGAIIKAREMRGRNNEK